MIRVFLQLAVINRCLSRLTAPLTRILKTNTSAMNIIITVNCCQEVVVYLILSMLTVAPVGRQIASRFAAVVPRNDIMMAAREAECLSGILALCSIRLSNELRASSQHGTRLRIPVA